jgi:hypothetical protein
MSVGYAVLAVITALSAVWFLRTGVRQWHGKGRPLSYWLSNGPFDAQTLAGYDRASLAVGATTVCFTVLLGGAAILGPPGKSTPAGEIAVYVAAIAGIFVSAGLFTGIFYYNWPKFLVPPHLRGQVGATEGRRRERAARQAEDTGRRPKRTGKSTRR